MAMGKIYGHCLLAVIFNLLLLASNGKQLKISGSQSQTRKIECWTNPADIVIVLDSSRSIWPPDFQKQLDFVKDMVDTFDVGMGPMQIRIGVMSFSNLAQIELNLDESTDKEEMKYNIDNIQQLKQDTNLGDALHLLRTHAFKPEQGSRSWVRRIGIILTDGQSQDKTETQLEAKDCKDSKIELFAIGIGNSISQRELRGIASNPKSKYYIHTPSYRTLDLVRRNVMRKTCQEVTTRATTPTTTTVTPSTTTVTPSPTPVTTEEIPKDKEIECKNKVADVFFLLDSSSSIRVDEFKKQINVLQSLVEKFDIGPFKTRIGVSVFSHEYYSKLKFGETSSKEEILKIIGDIEYLGGGTKTGKALREMRINEFNLESGRPEVEKILILFTDGQSADADLASTEAKLLKKSGVKLFVVGIGPFVDRVELEDIASRPSESFVHTFASFDELITKRRHLSTITCTVKDQIFVREEKGACNATQLTDVMFMVSHTHFGKEKTDRILKASAEVIRRVGLNGSFRFGTLFEECLPQEGIKIESITNERQLVTEIVNFRPGSLSSLVRQLRTEKLSLWGNIRNVGILFLDSTIDLTDPQIQGEIKGAVFKGIQIYVVIIGKGVDIVQVENYIAPRERIIFIKSYKDIIVSLPFKFTDKLCTRGSNSGGFKPDIS